MYTYKFAFYTLLLSYNPCDIFDYYDVKKMHGLSKDDCLKYKNTTKDAYVAGWTNYVPKKSGEYKSNDPIFVFINLSRCTDDIATTGLVFHEMMHLSDHVYKGKWSSKEEEMILFAENETYKIVKIIKSLKKSK